MCPEVQKDKAAKTQATYGWDNRTYFDTFFFVTQGH